MTTAARRAGMSLGAVGLLALAGCGASSSQPSGPGMMGSGTSASGYQYSRLTCSAPADLPGRVVAVTLADMGMSAMMGGTAPMGARMMLRASVTSVPSGQLTFVAQNMGWRTHELVILPLPAGSVAGQRREEPGRNARPRREEPGSGNARPRREEPGSTGKIDESGSLGEASAHCAAGTGDGIPAGAVSWVTLTLPPGHYELVCNLANHYGNGMREEFSVIGG